MLKSDCEPEYERLSKYIFVNRIHYLVIHKPCPGLDVLSGEWALSGWWWSPPWACPGHCAASFCPRWSSASPPASPSPPPADWEVLFYAFFLRLGGGQGKGVQYRLKSALVCILYGDWEGGRGRGSNTDWAVLLYALYIKLGHGGRGGGAIHHSCPQVHFWHNFWKHTLN